MSPPPGCAGSPRAAWPPFTPAVRFLLILQGVIWLLCALLPWFRQFALDWLASTPAQQIGQGHLWQMITAMFVHTHIMHLLGNAVLLWLLGGYLEQEVGTRVFLGIYLLSGIGGDLCMTLTRWGDTVPALGASGAVFGILAAAAICIGHMRIRLYGMFPMTLRTLALIMIGLEFLLILQWQETCDGIGHWAHVGGALVGYGLARLWKRPARGIARRSILPGRKIPSGNRFAGLDIPDRPDDSA